MIINLFKTKINITQAESHLQGSLKRSVTTLRGGTLGYAEIVAFKVI